MNNEWKPMTNPPKKSGKYEWRAYGILSGPYKVEYDAKSKYNWFHNNTMILLHMRANIGEWREIKNV